MNNFSKRIFSSIIILPVTIYIIYIGGFIFDMFLFICFLITIFEWYNMCKEKKFFILGFIFIFFSLTSISLIRNNISEDYSLEIFLLIFLICVSTDLGGYFFGKIFKGPKLTTISPNKTYAGAIGSYFLSIILSFFFLKNGDKFNLDYTSYSLDNKFIILVIILSSVSQLGDISISFFKRLSNIKDTGNLIPGHGGLLDRIDGMIFAFPAYYVLDYLYL